MIPASTCNGNGTCVAGSPITCAPYACVGTACKTSCATVADCWGANSCIAKSCGLKGLGQTCGGGSECRSGVLRERVHGQLSQLRASELARALRERSGERAGSAEVLRRRRREHLRKEWPLRRQRFVREVSDGDGVPGRKLRPRGEPLSPSVGVS
jgi:hypothetical protein